MNRIFIELIWVIFSILLLAGGLITPISFPIAVIVVFLILVWRFIMYKERKRKKERNIPLDILKELEYAERRWNESNGQTEPHTILWEIAKSNQRGLQQSSDRIQENRIGELPTESSDRFELQSERDTGASIDKKSPDGFKRDYPKRLFRRR